ncbi:MAG: Beta-lactamase inhibitor [Oscillospiraceae bacterium]|jgi:hypothetical protein|nr:Beta-lactamase inhibitor [Oscillospiraceae bacterium]
MRCEHCGRPIDKDSEYCKYCGRAKEKSFPIEEVVEAYDSPEKQSDDESSWVIVVAIPLAFILFFVFWFGNNPYTYNGGKAKSSPPQVTSSTILESDLAKNENEPTKSQLRKCAILAVSDMLKEHDIAPTDIYFSQTEQSGLVEQHRYTYTSRLKFKTSEYPYSVILAIDNKNSTYECYEIQMDVAALVEEYAHWDNLICLDEYNGIEMGMTYDDICKIIGGYGVELARTEMSGSEVIFIGWKGKGSVGANANVGFQNGFAVTKSQLELQ